jgi:zinc transport system substrate-binding protein
MAKKIIKTTILISLPIFFYSFGYTADQVSVFVTIAPQKYVVQQICKNLVGVQVMVPPGADPHTYEPKPKQMVAISKAKLYFAIGIEFEKANLKKIVSTNPRLKVVHTDQGIEKIPMAAHHHHDEEEDHNRNGGHHEEGEHGESHDDHGGLDPHIWLSPPLVKVQARAILSALQEIDPSHRNVYSANYKDFVSRIDELDAELRKTFAGREGLEFMVFHPAWGYFAHAYGLEQVPIEVEGKNPKPAQLKELIKHAREKGIKVIFVQPQFSAKSAEIVAREIEGQVVFADPLAEDWMANLRDVADKFKEALR